MRIGIIVAMESEFNSIKSILSDYKEFEYSGRKFLQGHYNDHNLIICVGGIGKANAAATAMLLDSKFVDLIISTGCAGGITKDLNTGDIVVGTKYSYHDVWCPLSPDTKKGELQGVPYVLSDTSVFELFDEFSWNDHKIGYFFTGDQFIETEDQCNEITKDVKDNISCVCDMESMAIAQICYQCNIKFISFRVISDSPCNHNDVNKHLKQYENFWSTMSDTSYKFLKSFLDSYKGN